MWVPNYSTKEVAFYIRTISFWKAWAEKKMVEWGVTGSPFDHMQRLVEEANKFEGVGHSRKG